MYQKIKKNISKRYPCLESIPTESEIVHIIPASWSNLKSFILNPLGKNNPPRFKNFTECLNVNWTLDIPFINFTSQRNKIKDIINTIEKPIIATTYGDSYSFHGDLLYLIWNTVISILVVFLLFKNSNGLFLLTQAERARAEDKNLHHDALIGIIICSILIFTLVLIWMWIKRRNIKESKTSDKNGVKEGNQRENKEQRFEMEIEEISNIEQLEGARRLVCILREAK